MCRFDSNGVVIGRQPFRRRTLLPCISVLYMKRREDFFLVSVSKMSPRVFDFVCCISSSALFLPPDPMAIVKYDVEEETTSSSTTSVCLLDRTNQHSTVSLALYISANTKENRP